MYAVIFRAKINLIDPQYTEMANKLRELAFNQFGCINFKSSTEGDEEIAISYWPSLESIANWKQNSEHQIAQEFGKKKWYSSYKIQILKVIQEYESN